jgi:hypothetical protein
MRRLFVTRFLDLGGGGCIPCTDDPVTGRCSSNYLDAFPVELAAQRRPYVHWALANPGGAGQTEGGRRFFVFGSEARGTFDHELGHTIDMHHPGPRSLRLRSNYNIKPNHYSRMNYRYQDLVTPGGDVLYSTGDFEPHPIRVDRLDECQPLGARDLSFLVREGADPPPLVCGTAASPAACLSTPSHSDIDWDGDGVIRRVSGTPGVACPPRDAFAVAYGMLGGDAHVPRSAYPKLGHAASSTASGTEPSSALDGPSMALRGPLLLMSIIDTRERLQIGTGFTVNDDDCPFTTSESCGVPGAFSPFGVIRDTAGAEVAATSAALLELRERPTSRQTLVVFQPPGGNLSWGYLTGVLPESFAVERRGTVFGGVAAERPSLARDPVSGNVVALVRTADQRVHELELDPSTDSWTVTTPFVNEGTVLLLPWRARGGVGLAAWRQTQLHSRALYAAYGRASDGRPFLVRRTARARWELSFDFFDASERVHRSVSIGVRGDNERLWALWGIEGPGFEPFLDGDRTSTLYTRSARPGVFGTILEARNRAVNQWTHEWGPHALLWDDRGGRFPGAISGIRVAFHGAGPCDRCTGGFFSDGVAPGGTHPSPAPVCLAFYCRDDLADPEGAGGFVQTFLHWLPFFDPADARVTLEDENEYPWAADGICRFVNPRHCAIDPLAIVPELPYLTYDEVYGRTIP